MKTHDKISVAGHVGEKAVQNWLKENGFKYCRGDEGNLFPGRTLCSKRMLPEFDCRDIFTLTTVCPDVVKCEFKCRPCLNKTSEFFTAFRWVGVSPMGPWKTKYFNGYCMDHLSFAARHGRCPTCEKSPCAARAYLLIQEYVHNFYGTKVGKRKGKYDYGSKYWDGHPGRLDYFAAKDGVPYVIEVKANTSRLSRWQAIRLEWMKRLGFNSYVAHVKFDYADGPNSAKLYYQSRPHSLLRKISPTVTLKEFNLKDYPQFREDIPTRREVDQLNTIMPWEHMTFRRTGSHGQK